MSLVDYVMEAMVAVRNTTQDGLKLTAGWVSTKIIFINEI